MDLSAKPVAELLDIFHAYGAAITGYESVLNRPRTTNSAASIIEEDLACLFGFRERIAVILADRSEPDLAQHAIETVAAFLATGTPFPAWAVKLVAKKAA